jgi:hypothetical protein
VYEDFLGDWPTRWELTAPESHVLSYRGEAWQAEPIRLAVTELVARRIVSTVEVEPSARRRKGPSWALVDGPNSKQSVEPPLDVVLDLIRGTERRPIQVLREGSTIALASEAVLVTDLHRAVKNAFKPLDAYRERHVGPALVDRGLLWVPRPREGRRAPEFDWTVAGREADAQLGRWLELGRDHLADWVRLDRTRALAFTREAGSAVLLMRDSYPELEELSRRGGPGLAAVGGGDGFAPDRPAEPHHPGSEGDSSVPFNLDGLGLDFGGLPDFSGVGDSGGGGAGGDGGGGGGGAN